MTPHDAERILSGAWSNNKAPIETCQLCQRLQPLFWHSMSQTVVDRGRCRRTKDQGMWLCSLCEEGVHQWMKKNPGKDAGREAVDAMVERLTRTLLGKTRPYRKNNTKESNDE